MTEAQVLERIKRKMAEAPDDIASCIRDLMFCPCCGQWAACDPDCTFATDDPAVAQSLEYVRGLVLGD